MQLSWFVRKLILLHIVHIICKCIIFCFRTFGYTWMDYTYCENTKWEWRYWMLGFYPRAKLIPLKQCLYWNDLSSRTIIDDYFCVCTRYQQCKRKQNYYLIRVLCKRKNEEKNRKYSELEVKILLLCVFREWRMIGKLYK